MKKKKHGGARPGAGRPKGKKKGKRTYTIDLDILEKNPSSTLVNSLLINHFKNEEK